MIHFAITLDPLHIGAGGYRLGRVDNTIVRDAGSGLPKVPGSSLAGVARSYLVQSLEGEEKEKAMACVSAQGNEKGNCGQCLPCRLFGYAASGSKQSKSQIGLFHFYDGGIVAFPVHTIKGPMWITSPSALAQVLEDVPTADENGLIVNFEAGGKINAGWLYLDAARNDNALTPLLTKLGEDKKYFSRLALAPDWLFGEMVNSNLEVRTSVSINPLTGAADSGKLFTYEAIPAATLLAFDIEIDEMRCPSTGIDTNEARTHLTNALRLCNVLGMGGMVTRGFGRVKFLGGE